jgi:mono/diheme cytochrome c family protein
MLKNIRLTQWGAFAAFIIYMGFAFQACTPTQNYVEMPVPNASLDTLGKGYALSQVHCSQCHVFKLPDNMRVDEWHTIVPGMAWNAGLDKEDEAAVLAYLVATTEQTEKSEN